MEPLQRAVPVLLHHPVMETLRGPAPVLLDWPSTMASRELRRLASPGAPQDKKDKELFSFDGQPPRPGADDVMPPPLALPPGVGIVSRWRGRRGRIVGALLLAAGLALGLKVQRARSPHPVPVVAAAAPVPSLSPPARRSPPPAVSASPPAAEAGARPAERLRLKVPCPNTHRGRLARRRHSCSMALIVP